MGSDTSAFRHAERAMYSLAGWFFHDLDVSIGLVGSAFYMPRACDPHQILQPFVEKAAKRSAS